MFLASFTTRCYDANETKHFLNFDNNNEFNLAYVHTYKHDLSNVTGNTKRYKITIPKIKKQLKRMKWMKKRLDIIENMEELNVGNASSTMQLTVKQLNVQFCLFVLLLSLILH